MTNLPVPVDPPADQPLHRDLGEGLEALRDSGLLYLLNQYYLHGAGYEARVSDGRLLLFGDGRQVISWPPELAEGVDEIRRAARQTLLDAEQKNWPGHYEGHSPGFSGRSAVNKAQIPGGGVR